MKLHFHYCAQGFSNCYLLGTDPPAEDSAVPQGTSPQEAIIIDPGMMDSNLLSLIEENQFLLRGVLITHDHPHHVRGLTTIFRIYNTEIYAMNPVIGEHHTTLVRDGDEINIGPFRTEVFSIPGHSADSLVFKIDRLLFTGDALSAGLTGSTSSSYAAANQISALRRKILSLPGDYTILPGHGPPSSLEAERRFNLDINSFEQQRMRRPAFRFEF
ncbi:MAG: MBL fold metallo-hydrolase [Treponema sp.]|jgi:glyoxylase-like metal-dependent hydrolase (beta-lactamase superfamily II)|nr:MBL fold metallo-hydrolase [Treponema sp.]